MHYPVVWIVLVGMALVFHMPNWAVSAENEKKMEAVEGQGCYRYGDEETPGNARQKAEALAREQAVSSFRVWVESSAKVLNYQLQEELIQTISGGMLEQVKIENEIRKDQEICITISAKLAPQDIDQNIAQRQEQQKIQESLSSDSQTLNPDFGLRIWSDKADGQYVEDDYLIIKVQSERDAYLKLDYFQADCTVVHLVPNIFRAQAFIEKGKIYEFGGENSPERFQIQKPFGGEFIKAVASQERFLDSFNSTEKVSDCKPYAKKLKKELQAQSEFGKRTTRGIAVRASGISSGTMPLYTSSLEVLEHKKALKKAHNEELVMPGPSDFQREMQ